MNSREIYDSQIQNETPSDEFVLHLRLPSLQQMAYNQIAIAVWYGYCSTPHHRDYGQVHLKKSINRLELMDCDELIKTLTMPRFMKEILRKYLKRVREETISCTRFFKYELLSSRLEEYRMGQVDWEYFVWCPDGRINYKSTAIKMLHSRVLTEVQKFAIISNFCLENEIKSCDLNHRLMETFIPKVNRARDPLLFYWICFLKNELQTITLFFLRSSDRHDDRFHHCEAFDYFWNGLSAEEQVSFMSDRLRTFERSHWHYRLFRKMSHDQLSNLLLHQPVAVISVFIKGIEMPEWASMAWKRCKNWISDEQFVDLFDSLLDGSGNNPILHQEYKMSVLLEIWDTANDHQKIHAARQVGLEETVLDAILYYRKKLAPSSFKFLLKYLSLKSADFRKNLILESDPSFIFYFDFNMVRDIFELCLPNFQGMVELKTELIDYIIHPYFCEILYTVEDYDELNRRLLRSIRNLNISSKHTLEKFVESLLAIASKTEYQTHYPSDLARLSKFVSKILQENVSAVLKMKESYFSSFSANSDPYGQSGSLNELSELIEQEFVHEHVQELKHRLAKILQDETLSFEYWSWYECEIFTHLFPWCYENEEEMRLQVNRFIPIKNIICEFLEEIGFRIVSFIKLERFLDWYFYSVEEVEMILSDNELNLLYDLDLLYEHEANNELELKQKYDPRFRRKFLKWIGHPIEFQRKKSTYGIIYFLFIFLFAVLYVIFVRLFISIIYHDKLVLNAS